MCHESTPFVKLQISTVDVLLLQFILNVRYSVLHVRKFNYLLQEGSRYNALHICANRNKPEACKLILSTIQDSKFAQLLYPDDTEETRLSRIDFFTDLYLNTPDKHVSIPHFVCIDREQSIN
jgi:hypothetical protein